MNDREKDKIRKYELSKYIISKVMILTYIACIVFMIIYFWGTAASITLPTYKEQYITKAIWVGIVGTLGIAWVLFIIKLLLCAVCDHIIELCYLNIKRNTVPKSKNGVEVEYL